MTEYKTCKHTHDTGCTCKSAAAANRDYCAYHLHHRARQLRIAQSRARNELFDLKLPPIESMTAVLSAVNQLVEAVAADMLDLKRADFLLKTLRFAAHALKSSDKWQPSVYQTDVPAAAIDLQAEYGLPEGINVSVPPEVAFPPPDRSSGGCPTPPSFGGVGPVYPMLDREPLFPEIPKPYVRDYMAEVEAALFETTPEDVELHEILQTEGYKAMESRAQEHRRNSDRKKRRKLFRANYERYVAEAKLRNIQRAAEKLIADRLAAEKAAAKKLAAEKLTSEQEAAQNSQPDLTIAGCPIPPASGWPIPPAVGGVGAFPDTTRKPVASVSNTGEELQKEA